MIKPYTITIVLILIGFTNIFGQNNPSVQVGDIVINELMASNDAIAADETGEYDDWIEIYNKGNVAIDISGYFLTDKTDNPDKWELPAGSILQPDSYLIVWADEDSSQGPLHANFKLSSDGEIVLLLDPDFNILDEVSFGPQTTDISYARSPNGTGDFVQQAATFAANNDGDIPMGTGLITTSAIDRFNAFPNPATNTINIKSTPTKLTPIWITNPQGKKVWQGQTNGDLQINISNWTKGLYFIQSDGFTQKLIVVE